MAIKNTIIDVQSVQVLDRLYVFETTPYEIEYDESVTRIYVVDECYDAFLEVNPTAPLKTFNPEAIQAALPEWYEYVCVAIDEDSNSALLSLLYDNGLIENEDYATYAEIRAINSSQFADAFSSASSLTSFDEFELFTGVKKLGDYAFSGCPNMESIKFPESVYKLGKNVLSGCNSLENVEVDGNNAHFYSPEGSNLIVDKTTRTIVAGCGSSTIPSDVYYIGDYAFAGSNLTEITIPSNIREIGDHAFDGCSALEYVEMESENPPKIGDNVFDDVSEDFEIDVPEDAVETYTEDDGWSQYAEYINGGQPQPHPKDLSDDEFGLESNDITITNEQMPVIIPLVNTHNLPVTYASSDTSIATVDQTGAVTLSYDNGNTNITVSFAGNDEYKAKTLTYAVTVAIPQELSDAEFSWSASSATATEAGSFSGVTLINTHGLSVSYSSSDTSVATIEPTYGHVMVSADGTTVISAAFAGNAQYKAKTVTYTLTVSLAQDLTDQEFGLSSSSTTISTEGATVTLPVINIYNLPVTYTTSNNVVATVDASGNVTLSYVDGVALISIAFAGNSTYKAKTLVYSITVDMPAQIEHVMHTTFTIPQNKAGLDIPLVHENRHTSYFNSVIIDNVEMPMTYTYQFTEGNHTVDYKIVSSTPQLGDGMFNSVNQMTSAYIPDGITAIPFQLFFNNTGVSYIGVPSSVTTVAGQSFRGTTNLNSLVFPDTVTSLAGETFRGSGVSYINIPSNITAVPQAILMQCANLTQFEIPAQVTAIQSQAFDRSALTELTCYNTTPPTITNINAFNGVNLTAIYVPFANVPDYQAANNWSTYASIIQPIGGKHTLTDAEFGLSSSSATITNSGSMSDYLVNTYNLPVTYSSSDSTVLTVDSNGDLTVVADGSATITVSFTGNGQYLPKTLTFSATCTIPEQLSDQELGLSSEGISIDDSSETVTLPIVNVYNLPLTYSTTNQSVATVDSSGNVTLTYENGMATIYISFAGNAQYAEKTLGYTINVDIEEVVYTLKATVDLPNTGTGGFSNYFYDYYSHSIIVPNTNTINRHIQKIRVDGVELNEIPADRKYVFQTPGKHIVEYAFDDPTIIYGDTNGCNALGVFNYYLVVSRSQDPESTTTWPTSYNLCSIEVMEGVTTIQACAFKCYDDANRKTAINDITLPSTVTFIGGDLGGKSLVSLTVKATTPPTAGGINVGSIINGNNKSTVVFVPDESLSVYKSTTGLWAELWKRMYGINEGVTKPNAYVIYAGKVPATPTRNLLMSSNENENTTTLFSLSGVTTNNQDEILPLRIDRYMSNIEIDGHKTYLFSNTYEFAYSAYSYNHSVNYKFSYTDNDVPTYLFSYCDDIKSVTLTYGTDKINAYAFNQCRNLESVYLPETVTYIGTYAFYNEAGVTISYFDMTSYNPPVLGDNVFGDSTIEVIHVPEERVSYYKEAAGWSDYSENINPEQPVINYVIAAFNVTSAPHTSYLYNSNINIKSIKVDDVEVSISTKEYTFDTTGRHEVKYELIDDTYLAGNQFSECVDITELYLPDSITNIMGQAIANQSFTSFEIPENVTTIGDNICGACPNLVNLVIRSKNPLTIGQGLLVFNNNTACYVTFPQSLRSLGNLALYNAKKPNYENLLVTDMGSLHKNLACGQIKNRINLPVRLVDENLNEILDVVIPEDTAANPSIAAYAFYNCTRVNSITFNNATPPTLGTGAFDNMTALTAIYVPAASVDTYKAASGWSSYANIIQAIPQEGYTINYSIKLMQNVDDPESYQNIINESAFYIENPQTGESEFSIDYFNEIVNSISLDGNELLVKTEEDLRIRFVAPGEGHHDIELNLVSPIVPSMIFSNIPVYKCHVGEGITTIGINAFTLGFQGANGPVNGATLYLPSTITEFKDTPFNMSNTFKLYMNALTPPVYNVYETIDNGLFEGASEYIIIFVPDAAVNTYKAHATWSAYANNIRGLSAAKTNLSDSDFGFYNGDQDIYQDYGEKVIDDTSGATSFMLEGFSNNYNVEFTYDYDDTLFSVDESGMFTVIDTNRWTSASNTYTITVKFNGDDAFNAKTLTYNVITEVAPEEEPEEKPEE